MFKKYIVIEDSESFDNYSVITKKEYKINNMKNDILYRGNAENCNEWIRDNLNPEAADYDGYLGEHYDENDENVLFI